jgi:hypothetical protein
MWFNLSIDTNASQESKNTMTTKPSNPRKMTTGMENLLIHFVTGASVRPTERSIKVGTEYHYFTSGSFVGLIDRKYVEMVTVIDDEGDERKVWVISEAGKSALRLPANR